jgi:hypothetical protein
MKIEKGIIISVEKVKNRKENKVLYDIEVADNHNFFANKVLTHNSGSPFREDQRENYIFALTGFPIGISWDSLIEEGIIEAPDVILYILSDYKAKESKLAELLQQEKKTIVFCDKINLGKSLSKKFEIPFVYGQTKDRLEIINKSDVTVVSRVGDEGLSLPDIERVIEIDFLFGCYDDKTEVLTKNGWKFFKDLSFGDEIATLNKNGELEFRFPSDIQRYYYNGDMLMFGGENSTYDLLVTPEHNMFVRSSEKYKFKRADELSKLTKAGLMHYELKKDCIYKKEDNIDFFEIEKEYLRKKSPITKANPIKIPINSFIKFMGWYLSEGSIWGGNIQIPQKKEEHRKNIIQIIKDMGFKPSFSNEKIIFYSRPLVRYLEKIGTSYDKFIPSWIKELSSKKLELLIECMMKGDGSNGTYYTASRKLADDFQEVCIKAGYATTLMVRERIMNPHKSNFVKEEYFFREYSVHITKNATTPEIQKIPKLEKYDGEVFDVTIEPYHTLLVRRNGRAVWSGNSRRQEGQRMGRLFHGEKKGEHIVLMTEKEYEEYGKRLFAITERGFKIEVRR